MLYSIKLDLSGLIKILRAHNPKVVGSNPAPATNKTKEAAFFDAASFSINPSNQQV